MIWVFLGTLTILLVLLIVVWMSKSSTAKNSLSTISHYPCPDPMAFNPEVEYFLNLETQELTTQSLNELQLTYDQIIKVLQITEFLDDQKLARIDFWKNSDMLLYRPSKIQTFYPEILSSRSSEIDLINWKKVIPPYCFVTRNNSFCTYQEYDALIQFHTANSAYDIFFYDFTERKRFLENYFDSHIVSAYESCRHEEHQAIIWGLAVLYYYGGVYLSPAMLKSQKQLETILNPPSGPEYDFYFSGFGGIIASRPGNNHLLEYLEKIVSQINSRNNQPLVFDSEKAADYWKSKVSESMKVFLSGSHRTIVSRNPFY